MGLHHRINTGLSGAIWHVLVLVLALLGFFLLGPQPYVWSLGERLLDAPAGVGGVWTLGWLQHALSEPGLSLWNPPVLFPLSDTLALGQPLLGCLPFYLPAAAITGNTTLALNLTILAGMLLSAYLTFLLVRRLSGSPWAGLAAGLLFAFNPLQWSPAPQGALQGGFFWAPLALLAMSGLRPGRSWLLWAAALPIWVLVYTVPAQGLGVAALAGVLLAWQLARAGRAWLGGWRMAANLAGSLLVSLALIIPLLARMGASGRAALLERAVRPGAVALMVPPGGGMARVYGWLHDLGGAREGGIFPGMALLILLLLALASLKDRHGQPRGIKTSLMVTLLCVAGAAMAPGALGMALLLSLCVCAGLALAWVAPRVSGRPLPGRLALAAALLAAINLDYWLVESRGLRHGPDTFAPEVYSYLASSPRKGPVLELPVSPARLAYQPLHWRPLLAGPAWWRAEPMTELLRQTRACPDQACLEFLSKTAAQTVVVHGYRLGPGGRSSWLEDDLAASGFALMGQVGTSYVWERSKIAAPTDAASDVASDMPPPLPDDATEEGFEKSELKAMDAPAEL